MISADLWKLGTAAGEIVLRCAIVYLFILVGLRVTGKREAGQMTPFDLVLILLIANAVQNAMVGPDNSLLGGLIAAGALLLLNFGISRFVPRSRALSSLVKGHATLLVNRGIVLQAHLAHEGITYDELMAALREHGVAHLDDVRLAVLEVDGSISVLKNEDVTPRGEKSYRRFRFLKHP
ncbi:MAG TPA: YetF domain-containing protein [Thermoanaerobaculia bacterium]|nr:YetF domain-containing protein [Thermoanaerobaculia bacterium]